MSVQLQTYRPSNPSEATNQMAELRTSGFNCPMCGRVAKWYYNFHKATSKKDRPMRCPAHEMSPIPGPNWASDEEKVSQLY